MGDDIIASWEKNAKEWINVIQNRRIPSRKFTNAAILRLLGSLKGEKIIDVGCGEGWLTREMGKMGWEAAGVDAIETLIVEARKNSSDSYHLLTYEAIIAGTPIPGHPFDVAVFNFCLYQKEGLISLMANTLQQLTPKGVVVIQTLHPFFLLQLGLPYKSQWLQDSWKGLPGDFTDGHAWYARTMEDWSKDLNRLKNIQWGIKEVLNNEGTPVSLMIKIEKH